MNFFLSSSALVFQPDQGIHSKQYHGVLVSQEEYVVCCVTLFLWGRVTTHSPIIESHMKIKELDHDVADILNR